MTSFFNKYAGYRADSALSAPGAWALLHVGLDSSDTARFPEATYGTASLHNAERMVNIAKAFSRGGLGKATHKQRRNMHSTPVAERSSMMSGGRSLRETITSRCDSFLCRILKICTRADGAWALHSSGGDGLPGLQQGMMRCALLSKMACSHKVMRCIFASYIWMELGSRGVYKWQLAGQSTIALCEK